jgi:hypothetical protein
MSDTSESELLETLRSENQRLRDLIVSLSATLLRSIARESSKLRRAVTSADAERLVREAEDCFRCARVAGLKKQIAEGLEVAGHEFMAKAVEIETMLQREKRKK